MFCKFCGKEIPDGANFCKHCGKQTTSQVSQNQESETDNSELKSSGSETAKTESATAVSDNVKNALQDKKKCGIIIAVVAAVVAVFVGVTIFNLINSQIPASAVEDSLKQSETFTKGFVSSNFTNGSDYSFSDIEITKAEDSQDSYLLSNYGKKYGSKEIKYVEFKGKMKNDSFESEFTGTGYYIKTSSGWVCFIGPDKTWSSTKPLKAVESFDLSSQSSLRDLSSVYSTMTTDNFQAQLNDNNGVYSCEATQDVKLEYWFGSDTATVKQKFKFNPEKGWEKDGESQIESQKTEYNLAGRSFEYTYSSTDTITMTFNETDSDEAASADYKIDHSPSASASSNAKAVNLEGTATGNFSHKFGQASFSVELNDSDNEVTFSCDSTYAEVVAGVGGVNGVYFSLKTNSYNYEGGIFSSKYTASGTLRETKKS